jgi:GTP-binding protein
MELLREELSSKISNLNSPLGSAAPREEPSIPIVFISAVTGFHLDELKDVLWRELNSESNKLKTIEADDRLVHRDKDMDRFAEELIAEEADDDIEYIDEEEIEELDDFEYDEEG